MPAKKAQARIKIDKIREAVNGCLIDYAKVPANVIHKNNFKITYDVAKGMGDDFEKTTRGYVDYLLLDEKGFSLVVPEAKSEDKNPLVVKEQARKYARYRTMDLKSY